MAELKSRQIGKYQIQAELGRGGFGSVYRAYDPTVGRLVAIKVLTAPGDHNLLTRFKNEAAAAGNLRHKNIVTIYDFGDHEGLPYIVMEFLDGEDLQQIISQNKSLTLLQKVSIMLQVADGLHCAHRSGIVHRDVKPGNIRLLPDGTVKIMDFGIARLVAGVPGGARLTRQGHVIGTLLYMAPEQVRGGEADFLCDIFAYGITYYELLAGKHPFQGSDPRTVFYRITGEDPAPMRSIVPECPEALEAILNRALSKDRELRYQSLREVQLDSEPLLIELRQERASNLLSEANRLYKGGQLDSALAVLSEVFDLDPGNREARQLRETIQGKLLRRVIEPKIEALVRKGGNQIAERQFQEAIESYEAALRLDRDNTEVKERLERARELLNISRESARKVADARREFARNNLESALQILPEMLEADPGNPDARQLLQEVRRELDRREKERVYEKKIQHARELLQANRFDDALSELNSLGEGESGREEASQLAAQIRKSKQSHERQQKCKEELALACEMLNAGQYEGAIPRLERVMNKYPEEPEATRLFIAAHKKLASKRKSESVQNLEAKVASLVGSHRFDAALEAANEALREYPAEQRLLEVIREIEIGQEKHRRAEVVSETLVKARASVAEEALEIAVQTLERACAEFPGEEQLASELSRVRILVEERERDRAIDDFCRQAIACSERQEFDRALEAIDQGVETHGADERLAGAREIIVHDRSNWARSEAVRHALDQSSRQILEGDPWMALETLEAALAQYPGEPRLEDALAAAKDAVALARREAAIVGVHLEAGSQLERREFDSALAGLEQAIEVYGADQRLTTLRDQVIAAEAAWVRQEAIRQAVAEVKRLLAANDPDGALQATEVALAQYPEDETLLSEAAFAREAAAAKRRNAAIEDVCRTAGMMAGREDFGSALEEIARGIAEYGADPRLLELEQQTTADKVDWQRRKDIHAVLEECEQCVARGTPEAALQLLEEAMREHKGESQLEAALASAQQALDAKTREAAVQKIARHVRRFIKNREFKKALAVVEQELENSPGDPRLTELGDQVLAAEEAWNREQVVRQTLLTAAELEGRNRAADALEALRGALEKYPNEPRLVTAFREIEGSWQRQVGEESLRATLEQSQHLLSEDPRTARRMLEQALAEHPEDPRLTAALEDARKRLAERQREDALLATLDEARSLLAEDPYAARRMLEEALAEHPEDPRLAAALDDARSLIEERQREKSIDSACFQTRLFLDVREFDPALETIETALQAFGGEQRLEQMRETVLASKADFERAEGIRRAVEDAGRYGNEGQLEEAVESLLSATRLFGPAEELTTALAGTKLAIEKRRRQEEIERFCRQAEAAAAAGSFDQAARLLEEAERVHGAAPEFADSRRRLDSARAEQERRKAVERAIQEINALIARDSLDQAVQAADSALARYGGEAGLTAIRGAAVKARDAKRRDEAIEKFCEEIRASLKRKGSKAALKMIQQGQKTFGADSRFDQLRADAGRVPIAAAPAAKPIVATAPLPPAGASRNSWGLRIAAGVGAVGVFAGALWWSGFGSTSKTVRLAVKASPANASVKVENQTCTNGDCSFDVKPGVYPVEVSADGYQSRIEEARLTLGSDAPAMAVTLKALPPTIQVAANFVDGQVSLDGRAAGQLTDGQFSLEALAPGKHELRIAGKDGTATLAFQADFAKLPLLGLISSDGVDAIALGSFANQATVSCSVCTGAVSVDDQPAHETKVGDGAFSIGSLSTGTHQLRVKSGAVERSMVFATGGAPAINLALTSNRNYGMLVVDTGEDGATVFVDGHRYARTTARAQLRMTVEAKEHVLRVAKNGFRVEPADLRVTVVKGGQVEARFHLTGEAARLSVSNGMPGTTVAVDGRIVGTVAADGSFATQVAPGEHRVDFARDGFITAQISRQFVAGRSVLLSTEAQLTPLVQAKASPKAPVKPAVTEASQPDAAAQESADWQRVARTSSVADVEDFLRKHPGGANAADAQRVLERLEWNATNRTNKAALQQFLSRHGDGSHAQEARSLLTGIETQEAEELAAAQRTREQAARTANDLRVVSETLKAFESAYNRRDLAELQRLWNPMPKGIADNFRDQFRQAKELAFRLRPSAAPSTSGDTATAVCTRTLSFTARTGQRLPETSQQVRVTLGRAGSEWVIRSIVGF